jgi:hypothetical protein
MKCKLRRCCTAPLAPLDTAAPSQMHWRRFCALGIARQSTRTGCVSVHGHGVFQAFGRKVGSGRPSRPCRRGGHRRAGAGGAAQHADGHNWASCLSLFRFEPSRCPTCRSSCRRGNSSSFSRAPRPCSSPTMWSGKRHTAPWLSCSPEVVSGDLEADDMYTSARLAGSTTASTWSWTQKCYRNSLGRGCRRATPISDTGDNGGEGWRPRHS